MKRESQCLELVTAALDKPFPWEAKGGYGNLHNPSLISLYRQPEKKCISVGFKDGNLETNIFASNSILPSFAAALRDVVDALDEIVAEIQAKQLPDAPTGGAEEFNPFRPVGKEAESAAA